MKKLIFVLSVLFLFGCSSTTYIKTMPSGAKVYEGDALKGFTPYMHWDREAGETSRTLRLHKEGYKDKTITIKKTDFNPLRLVAPPILALPWIYDYPSEYVFELEKSEQTITETVQKIPAASNIEIHPNSSEPSQYSQKLRELRKLKEEGLLTDKEYEQKRKAIVDSM
jgi:hypothetical protein